jgi:L-threonylcarbamoyladenylate synthase
MKSIKMGKDPSADIAAYKHAANLLRAGELVAFPTETVYGLGGDASNLMAVAKIFAAKQRPANHPLILHIGEIKQLYDWSSDVPESAIKLAEKFWPGPLTLILKASEHVPAILTGGQKTIGIRMPGHPVARKLLSVFGGAIAAPSANKFGRISPTCAEHVIEELGDVVEIVLDGGSCSLGLESTIIDLSANKPRILRPGPLTIEEIGETLGESISTDKNNAPRVSGSLSVHYAPHTPTQIIADINIECKLTELQKSHAKIVVISRHPYAINFPYVTWHVMPTDPKNYGQQLYAQLRNIDHLGFDLIIIEELPNENTWLAIRDRLNRAAHQA